MYKAMNEWKHMFKLDPAKDISDEELEILCESGTDAIIVGGTDNVTLDGVLDLLAMIRRYSVPCILEISDVDVVTPGFDHYFIPMVMNSTEKKWMMDIQHEAIKEYKDIMDWNDIFVEGYCILNRDAKAYQKANCKLPTTEDVTAYAYMAENVFHLPVFYIEYSGTYGDPELVKQVKNELNETMLLYGGGITNLEQAQEMKEYADVIIVGNSIYTDFKQAVKTVQAVNEH